MAITIRHRRLIEQAIKKIVINVIAEDKYSVRRKSIHESIDFKSPKIISKIKSAAIKFDAEIKDSSEPVLLIDSNRGQYMYQSFAAEYVDIDLDPNDEYYLDDYQTLENKINSIMKNGYVIVAEDLWLYPNDYESDESY